MSSFPPESAALRRFALAASAALLAALAGCRCRAPAADAAPAAVRVGTYNIRSITQKDAGPRSWKERREQLADLLRRLECDVMGLQEVKPAQMDFLRKALPEFEFAGEYRSGDPAIAEASPVCYRKDRFDAEASGTFWLSETPDVPGSVGWDAKYPRVCSYLVLRDRRTGRRFSFANCHTDHKGALAREKGMLLAIDRVREFGAGAPIVFTGDHNCRETDAPAKAVSGLLRNALYISETRPAGPWRTFNGWMWGESDVSISEALACAPEERNAFSGSPDGDREPGGGYRAERCGARIDYIYVSEGVRVIGYRTVDTPRPGEKAYLSDHFPIVSEILIP